jgi:hypothetical protein
LGREVQGRRQWRRTRIVLRVPGYETEADVELFLEERRKAMDEEAEKEETTTKEDNAS